jgi:exonuclease VII small subunit
VLAVSGGRDAAPPLAIVDAVAELEKAGAEFDLAQSSLREASSRDTAARNRLNQAQKKVDEVVAAFRKAAPRDTDWARKEQSVAVIKEVK